MAGSITMVANWRAQMETRLSQALAVTMDVCGKSLAQACARMIILMAQSARALTKKAKKNREIKLDVYLHGAKYVEIFKKGKSDPIRFYQFQAQREGENVWSNARKIGNAGLAKRSWMWGLKSLKGSGAADSRSIPGVGVLRRILTDKVGGFILTNNLSYLQKILPLGWLRQVEQSAVNKVMKQAETKLIRDWERAIQITGGGKNTKPDMAKYVRAA